MSTFNESPTLQASHYALSANPGERIAPGGELALCYRAFNASSEQSPAARIRFLLPPDVEPLVDVEQPLDPLDPGSAADVVITVRVARPLANATSLTFQAAVIRDGMAPLGSNVVRVMVTSRARFDPSTIRTRVTPAEEPQCYRAAITLANVGDDTADGWTLDLPVPLGCEPLDAGRQRVALDGLAPGEERTLSRTFRIVDPPAAELIADGAYLTAPGGKRIALPASESCALAAEPSEPSVSVLVFERRLALRVHGVNAGWAPLRDAHAIVTLPAGLRALDATAERDGAPVAVRCTAGVLRFPLEDVPAGGAYVLTCDLIASAAIAGGDIVAALEWAGTTRTSAVHFERTLRRAVTLRCIAAPAAPIDVGADVHVGFEIVNAGDTPRTLACESSAGRVTPSRVTLGSGARRRIDVFATMPRDCDDGMVHGVPLMVCDGAEIVAQATAPAIARNRAWLESDDWLALGGVPEAVLTNTGTTPAREVDIVFDDGSCIAIGTIEAGASRRVPLGEVPLHVALRGAVARAGERRWILAAQGNAARERACTVVWKRPQTFAAGSAMPVGLRIRTADAIGTLVVKIAADPAWVPLPGSTSANGLALSDRPDGPAPYSRDGLRLHAIPAETTVEIDWLVHASAAAANVMLRAALTVDGAEIAAVSDAFVIASRGAFDLARADVPFHIEGIPIERPSPPSLVAAVDPIEPPLSVLHFDPERSARAERMLAAGQPHLLALGVLISDDPALDGVRDAARLVADRLSVKVRIPGYRPGTGDCEDRAMRAALEAALATTFGFVPLGGATVLRIYAELLGRQTNLGAAVDAALAAYVDALPAAFERGAALEPEADLDRLRATFIAELTDAARRAA